MDLDYIVDRKRALRRQFVIALSRRAPEAMEALQRLRAATSADRRTATRTWAESRGLAAGGEPKWLLDTVQAALRTVQRQSSSNGLTIGVALALATGQDERCEAVRPRVPPKHHFDWLVQSQVQGWSYQRIAAGGHGCASVSRHAVRNRVQELREALELPRIRGGKRTNPTSGSVAD